jgi:hypothetical protein
MIFLTAAWREAFELTNHHYSNELSPWRYVKLTNAFFFY